MTEASSIKLHLVEIHDTNSEQEMGGPDLPHLVTVRVEGGTVEDALAGSLLSALRPFNLQPAARHALPGHLEFCSFAFQDEIREHFGVPPDWTEADDDFERLYLRSYARTVGELRAAIASLPDELPLVHTPYTPAGQHLNNRIGLLVQSGEWAFTGPGLPEWSREARWSLRIGALDYSDWDRVMQGTWRNITASDFGKPKG